MLPSAMRETLTPCERCQGAQDGNAERHAGGGDDAGGGEHDPDDPLDEACLQRRDAGIELVRRDVVAVLGGLPDGARDGVGVGWVDAGGGQLAGDRLCVEHRVYRFYSRRRGLV